MLFSRQGGGGPNGPFTGARPRDPPCIGMEGGGKSESGRREGEGLDRRHLTRQQRASTLADILIFLNLQGGTLAQF